MAADRSFDFAVSSGGSPWMRRAGCSALHAAQPAERDETIPADLADAVVQQVYRAGLDVHRALAHLTDPETVEAELRRALDDLDEVVSRIRTATRWDGDPAERRPHR